MIVDSNHICTFGRSLDEYRQPVCGMPAIHDAIIDDSDPCAFPSLLRSINDLILQPGKLIRFFFIDAIAIFQV